MAGEASARENVSRFGVAIALSMENPNPFCGAARHPARTRRKDRTEITVLTPPSTTYAAAAPAPPWLLGAAAALDHAIAPNTVVYL